MTQIFNILVLPLNNFFKIKIQKQNEIVHRMKIVRTFNVTALDIVM